MEPAGTGAAEPSAAAPPSAPAAPAAPAGVAQASRTARRRAQCVREVGNFSRVDASLKYDSRAFDPARFLAVLPDASPKLVALLSKIAELDARDLAETGQLYKHCIYVDSKTSAHGAKLVAAAMFAVGYRAAYDRGMQIDIEALKVPASDVGVFEQRADAAGTSAAAGIGGGGSLRFRKRRGGASHSRGGASAPGGTFALLCSSIMYGKPVGVRFRKAIQGVFNARPENIHGEFIRFVIIDQGYREGVDLYDTRYCHVFEELDTPANERQAIGRNTRFCGQKGLSFHPTKGWPLFVFKYSVNLPDDMREAWTPGIPGATRLFDVYLDQAGIDVTALKFAATLDAVIAFGAADHDLTEHVHDFRAEEAVKSQEAAEMKGRVSYGLKKLMGILAGGATAKRKAAKREAKRLRAAAPAPGPKAPARRMGFFALRGYVAERFRVHMWPKPRMQNLCAPGADAAASQKGSRRRVSPVSGTPYFSAKSSFSGSPKSFKSAREAAKAGREAEKEALDTLKEIARGSEEGEAAAAPAWIGAETPAKPAGPAGAGGAGDPAPLPPGVALPPAPKIVTYSPTQEFVRSYFTPSSGYKGLLLAHSVGTGKTCSAIAIASTSFVPKGYSVLWVTRHTLKADIWKNMFKQVCDDDLRKKLKKREVTLPEDVLATPPRAPMRFVSKQWLPPISFKQFTNMLQGKNEVYAEMVRRNGKADPLRKTLIIIDEAHKLYDPGFAAIERPNIAVLQQWIQGSYATSGKDSCRLLLMTATPYTTDPMQFMSLMNLMRETGPAGTDGGAGAGALPEDFAGFAAKYLDERGRFTERSLTRFLDEISGYVSYLNREKDARTFAYPVYESVTVEVSRSGRAVAAAAAAELEAELTQVTAAINEGKRARGAMRDRVAADKKRLFAQCSSAPTPAERKACEQRIAADLDAFKKAAEEDIAARLSTGEAAAAEVKKKLAEARRAARDRKADYSQQAALEQKCGLPIADGRAAGAE